MLTEQDRAQQFGEALVARTAEIGFAGLRLEQDALGLLDHLEDRGLPGRVAEYADTDIDLVCPRVSCGHGNQREQRIVVDGRKRGKTSRLGGFSQHANALSAPSLPAKAGTQFRRRNPRPHRLPPGRTGTSAHSLPRLLIRQAVPAAISTLPLVTLARQRRAHTRPCRRRAQAGPRRARCREMLS